MTCCASRLAVLAVVALAASAAAFENAEMRRRKKARKEIVSFLNVPGYEPAAVACAACEAVARQVEDVMKNNQHKTDDVMRLGLLMESCQGIENQLPIPMPPVEEGGEPVLHFGMDPRKLAELKRAKDGAVDLNKPGLGEFCDALVEEYEQELKTVMDTATPLSAVGQTLMGKAVPRFELKEDICVRGTEMCSQEALNTISAARIKQADPELMKQFMGDFEKIRGIPKKEKSSHKVDLGDGHEAEIKVSEPQSIETAFPDGKIPGVGDIPGVGKKGGGKKGGKAKKPPAHRASGSSSDSNERPTLLSMVHGAVKWYIGASLPVQLGGALVTLLAVYIGGQVARIW